MTGRWLLAAVHKGPYLTLAPLEKELGAENCLWLLAGSAAEERRRQGLAFKAMPDNFAGAVAALKPRGLIRGTSGLADEENPECRLSEAFAAAGLPIYAVEDFPGNYIDSPKRRLDGLFIEHETTRRHHVKRGLPAERLIVSGNPRYAEAPPPSPTRAQSRRRYGLNGGPVLLWAGQPNRAVCRRTLKALWPALRQAGATVLFRAHPRDEGFAPALSRLGAGVPVVDVSSEADPLPSIKACDLVVTQFSSLAVEAGRLGIPSLFVLFPELGRRYLRQCNGMTELPWCAEGSAFLLDDKKRAGVVLRTALTDQAARRDVLRRLGAGRRRAAGAAKLITQRLH